MNLIDFARWVYRVPAGLAAVAMTPDGQKVVVASLGKEVLCLNRHGERQWVESVGNQVWHVGLSGNGQRVIAATGSNRFWDVGGRGLTCFSGEGTRLWEVVLNASSYGFSLADDGRTMAVGTSTKQLLLLDGHGRTLWQQDMSALGWGVRAFSTALSADGSLVVAGAVDGQLRLLTHAGELLAEYPTHSHILAVAMAGNGSAIAAGDMGGYLYFLNEHGHILWKKNVKGKIWNVKLSDDGQRLYVGMETQHPHLYVYDHNGRLVWRRFVGKPVSALAISRLSQQVVVGLPDGTIKVFDEEGNILHTTQTDSKVCGVAIADDGSLAVAVTENGRILGFETLSQTTSTRTSLPAQSASTPITIAVPLPPAPAHEPALPKTFGQRLRLHRQATRTPHKRPLTQAKLAELLGQHPLVPEYSHVTIAHWEKDRHPIRQTERPTLLALVRVLYQYGGLTTPTEANQLLFAGDYRGLDEGELQMVFG